jgi:hypothetical protein
MPITGNFSPLPGIGLVIRSFGFPQLESGVSPSASALPPSQRMAVRRVIERACIGRLLY